MAVRRYISRPTFWGHEAMAKLLVEKGAKLECVDTKGQTPLSYAAFTGREAVVKLLVEKGAVIRI
jgi:ankyrin repeat protein